MALKKPNRNSPKKPLKTYSTFLRFSTVAIQMGVVIAVFTYAGKYLDEKFPVYPHLFTVVLSLFGIGGSLYMVIREVMQMSKNNEQQNNDQV